MANPPKPWKAEYARSSRSLCRTCKSTIEKEKFRLGKMIAGRRFDGSMHIWNHVDCIMKKANQIKSLDDVEGINLLRWEDQQKIRKYVEGGSISITPIAANECAIEVSQNSRAACKLCNEKIMKGNVRVAMKPVRGAKGLAWHHVSCFIQMSPSTQVERLSGWDSLSTQDKEATCSLAGKDASYTRNDGMHESTENQEASSKGTKRKKPVDNDQKKKLRKGKGGRILTDNNNNESGNHNSSAKNLDHAQEEQNKALWAIKDDLNRHVTTAELREMLKANGQDSKGSEFDLRECCADGMLFGALGSCPECSGSLRYSGDQYHCHGNLSVWSKCAYATAEPVRLKGKWKIPEGTSNQYLCQWFKSQKANRLNRLLPPPSSNESSGSEAAPVSSPSCKGDKLEDLKVAIAGLQKESMEEWKTKIKGVGRTVHAKVKKDSDCLVVSGELDDNDTEIRKARSMKVPIVGEDHLVNCFTKQKKLPFDQYKIKAVSETSRNDMVNFKVKGISAVHEASGLQDSGHILEDGTSIYNTTMTMSDLATGVNSYYILQIIQEDNGSDCYVFRKWGRVGNDEIGDNKREKMSKSNAIEEFKRLFRMQTGNPWEAWENKKNFEKQPRKFLPLDMDYGPNEKDADDSKSKLAPQLIELIKMLSNVKTYEDAMKEFKIDTSKMPLGKLSKSNIQKGFEALTKIQNLLNSNDHDTSFKESLLRDASNRFFTVIPSIHTHVIKDEDDLKSKVKMLEDLQDIEIASTLICFNKDNDESVNGKYKKLRCNIDPLPHDSDDYQLVEKYFLTTHAPTHTKWTLELEEVFALDREGEFDKFRPYRDKLQNRMLLWHGSRLINFVGILSKGLRIALPKALGFGGDMFGKGVYFADLVSKSAQYCGTSENDPVGLMLLSEVALGEVHELKKASYMDPPEGKHSTKGLGKMIPQESEYVKWRDEVVVPCGQVVNSTVQDSDLKYNEYIVYNTAQVKMQFLLKVRFHHSSNEDENYFHLHR